MVKVKGTTLVGRCKYVMRYHGEQALEQVLDGLSDPDQAKMLRRGALRSEWYPFELFVELIENIDSFFRMEIIYPVFKFGLPGVYASGFVLLAAVSYLFLRRLFVRQVKYISIASDYFPLFLIFGIAFSGIFMRYVTKVDVTAVK